MTVFEIPLADTAQTLEITLGQTTYNITVKWNYISDCWVLDFADQNQNPILDGVPLVTGVDLLEQYAYLNFDGKLIAQTDNDLSVPPGLNNLGTGGNLYFITES